MKVSVRNVLHSNLSLKARVIANAIKVIRNSVQVLFFIKN